MIWHLDEPQADLAPLNVSSICRKAKDMGIKVLLGGAGGDDIFQGIRRHQATILNYKLRFLPKKLMQLFSSFFKEFPSNNKSFRRIKKLTKDWGKQKKKLY